MIKNLSEFEVWFVTGSQHLYGPETLARVGNHTKIIVYFINEQESIPVQIIIKPVLKTPEEILMLFKEASAADQCIGLIVWMHTFSPAKMWINGLKNFKKPLLHLHTQFNDHIPWAEIDMDFMNLNQSAHGDREFGFIGSRLQLNRKVVVGHWKESTVIEKLSRWSRVAAAWAESQQMKIARLGDNMRQVAVTEGNKVSAQIQFGYQVNTYGVGDLVNYIQEVTESEIIHTVQAYEDDYVVMPSLLHGEIQRQSLIEAARIEVGLRHFLFDGGFTAFTDTFEDLHGLCQLPGIAVQRLMAEGYGFAGEGDWKTAALVRTLKVMALGLPGGNSFMEDYTYHFDEAGSRVLGAHMLEICPSIAAHRPSCEVHKLGIGGKEDPVRLVFDGAAGPALNVSLIDLGNRFRLLVNEVEAVRIDHAMPKLPVARVLWKPKPSLALSAEAWILAGGAHHTCYSQNITALDLQDFAEMADIEIVVIDDRLTELRDFKQRLKLNEVYYHLK
ncbi:MAG: L-arabinose isomerase [Saprospiraceae bacterium]|nr:L-arabinose isomerase [Saprospiraceae bacterium]